MPKTEQSPRIEILATLENIALWNVETHANQLAESLEHHRKTCENPRRADNVALCGTLIETRKFIEELKRYREKAGFNPNQPRVPSGNPDGGRWTAEGSGGIGDIKPIGTIPPGREPDGRIVEFPDSSRGGVVLSQVDESGGGNASVYDNSPSTGNERGPNTTPEGATYDSKIAKDMADRDWTSSQIDEAVKRGDRIDAVNKATGAPATRYIHPVTGKSVVIDNTTNKVIQVGGENFKFSPASGDVPGARVRPAPASNPRTTPPSGGGNMGPGGGGFGRGRYEGPLRGPFDLPKL